MKFDRITINPQRMNGQSCIRNLRLTVRRVLEVLLLYPDRQELFQEYPGEERIIITLDADFHALLALSGALKPSTVRSNTAV